MEKKKIMLLGDTEVGKTSMIMQYFENEFSSYLITFNAEKRIKKIDLENGNNVTIEIWDTPGLEQLRALQNGMKIKVAITDLNPVGIDTMEDYEKFKSIVENN